MSDLYDVVYTNPIHVDECSGGACLGIVSTDPPALPLTPPFDTVLQISFPWFKGTEKEFIDAFASVCRESNIKYWFEGWTRFRTKQFVKLGYKDYLVPKVTDVEISFIESINIIQMGHGVKATCFKGLWDLWRVEVQKPYWVYHTGNCRYGYSIDTRSIKHTFDEKLITKRVSELSGESFTGYETAVCGCGAARCCNINKVYILNRGFFFKADACRLGLLPPEECRSAKCWQEHSMPSIERIHDDMEPK
jgi:hypothetical protein